MRKIILILLALVFLTSCGTKGKYFTSETNDVKTHIDVLERDTIFQIPEESNSLIAKLITVNGQVQLDQVVKSADSTSSVQPEVKIVDNYIHVDCHKKAQELFAEWKEQHKTKTITREITDYVEVEREFTAFERVSMWLGYIFMIGALVSIIIILTKIINPIKK